jgi:hypothetical protein
MVKDVFFVKEANVRKGKTFFISLTHLWENQNLVEAMWLFVFSEINPKQLVIVPDMAVEKEYIKLILGLLQAQ